MPDPQAPGFFIEETSGLPSSVTAASTTQVVFIGYTEKALNAAGESLHGVATPVDTLFAFEQWFGGPAPASACQLQLDSNTDLASVMQFTPARFYLHAALQLYFANGGGPCYIVSVGDFSTAAPECAPLIGGLSASAAVSASLLVCPEACALPVADYQQWTGAALAHCADLGDRFAILDMHGGAHALSDARCDITQASAQFRTEACPSEHLRYGAVYTPHVLTTLPHPIDHAHTLVRVVQANRLNRMRTQQYALDTLQRTFPAQYQACMTALRQLPYPLPPSAAVAGAYVANDLNRGVWKAPANLSLNAVKQPCVAITNDQQSALNVDPVAGKSINAIRQFSGKGTLIWGARTLDGNNNEWRYISTQRLAMFLQASIAPALQAWVFEANDANSWVAIRAMLENFMTLLWRNGALLGSKPEQAYYVRVGLGATMAEQEVMEGVMRVELGFAPVRPAEFIVLKFTVNTSSVPI